MKTWTIKAYLLSTASLCLLFAAGTFGQDLQGQPLEVGRKFTIHSQVMNEDRVYWVGLPASYSDPRFSPQRYPVVYVLDGKSAFVPLYGVVDFMSGRESVDFQIPEMIIVGIDNADRVKDLTPNASNRLPNGTEAKDNKMTAGSGGGELFFRFLEKELIPHIDASYRTIPYRVYIGHSLGGLTAVHALVNHPGLFNGYIAIDPSLWWDGASMIDKAAEVFRGRPESIERLYLSMVDAIPQGMEFHVQSIRKLESLLKDRAPAGLKWKLQAFPETDHSSIPLLSWYHGLLFLFQGYEPDFQAMMADPGSIEPHYHNLEETLGLAIPPPEGVFEILSHYLTAPNRFPDPQKALTVVEMGLKYHPGSPILNERLGVAYLMTGAKAKAMEAYEKALKLNPGNEGLAKKIRELKASKNSL
jgi:predicted alpha/beta superfamily hydrolase